MEHRRKGTVSVCVCGGGYHLSSWPKARLHMHGECPMLIRERLLRIEIRTERLGLNSDGTRAVLCGSLAFLLPFIFEYTVELSRSYMMCWTTTD